MKAHIHECGTPGLVMDGITVEEIKNCHGQHYWKATAEIGYVFGAKVDGSISGIGPTNEKALERLDEERHKLHESLFA